MVGWPHILADTNTEYSMAVQWALSDDADWQIVDAYRWDGLPTEWYGIRDPNLCRYRSRGVAARPLMSLQYHIWAVVVAAGGSKLSGRRTTWQMLEGVGRREGRVSHNSSRLDKRHIGIGK